VLAPELYLMALPPMLDERAGTMEERAVEVPGPLTGRLGALARSTGLGTVEQSLPAKVVRRVGFVGSLVPTRIARSART
jgi:formamidase